MKEKIIRGFRALSPLLLAGCAVGGASQPKAYEVVPTATMTAHQEKQHVDAETNKMFTSFLTENGFTEQSRHQLLGAEIVFWGKGGNIPADKYLGIMEASYDLTRKLGEVTGLVLPDPDTNPLSGEIIHIGIMTTPDTCVGASPDATVNQIQANLVNVTTQSESAQCETNAFSFATEAKISSGNYVGPQHLIIATPYFRQATCGGKVPFFPAGQRYCLTDEQSTLAGVGHEFVHQTLRALFGPRRNGPLTVSGQDLEEAFAQAVEAAIIEKELNVPSTR